jgi:hypothetical protein
VQDYFLAAKITLYPERSTTSTTSTTSLVNIDEYGGPGSNPYAHLGFLTPPSPACLYEFGCLHSSGEGGYSPLSFRYPSHA